MGDVRIRLIREIAQGWHTSEGRIDVADNQVYADQAALLSLWPFISTEAEVIFDIRHGMMNSLSLRVVQMVNQMLHFAPHINAVGRKSAICGSAVKPAIPTSRISQ